VATLFDNDKGSLLSGLNIRKKEFYVKGVLSREKTIEDGYFLETFEEKA
jgi:hypothetical protein